MLWTLHRVYVYKRKRKFSFTEWNLQVNLNYKLKFTIWTLQNWEQATTKKMNIFGTNSRTNINFRGFFWEYFC